MDRLKAWLPWAAAIVLLVTLGLQIWTLARLDAIESDISFIGPDASEQYDGPPWAGDLKRDASEAADQARKAARRSQIACEEIAGAYRCP
ncbi:hypothetical protein [Sphingopyxis terrae]|uniref:hypothetical protein n=1 Tax=Sphingopyxis terrae TaxID=33052 RepID=UPI003F7FB80A